MKLFKSIAAVAVLAASSFAANASMINVGGVVWNPDAATDFSAQQANMRQFINPTTGELSGWGLVTGFNGTDVNTFCPNCEVTFQFSGFLPTGGTVLPGIGQSVSYSGGEINVYVGPREIPLAQYNDYNALNLANTSGTPAQLFLKLKNNYTFVGTNLGNAFLTGLGLLDVVGGMAASNFDTNTKSNGADMFFSGGLSFQHVTGSILDMSGVFNLSGDSIPEPSSLAILGLGLLGLAGAARRKQAK
jgi:hypothetical protein